MEGHGQVGEFALFFRLLRTVPHLHDLAVVRSVDKELSPERNASYSMNWASGLLSEERSPPFVFIYIRRQFLCTAERTLGFHSWLIDPPSSGVVSYDEAITWFGNDVSDRKGRSWRLWQE